jgi:uncharacterized protein YbjT (DUF2867 family)
MKIIVFGATGRAGYELVVQALEAGHEVTAVSRHPGKPAIEDPRLRIVTGSLSSDDFLDQALAGGFDAALSTLGILHRLDETPLADLTVPILRALERHRIRRFVCMTSLGVGDSVGQGNFVVFLMTRLQLPYVLRDKERQEQLIRESDLDWSILRPPRLVKGPRGNAYVSWIGQPPRKRLRWAVTYSDSAAEMLRQLGDNDSIGTAQQMASVKS